MALNPVGTGRWQLIDGEPRAMVPTCLANRVMLAKLLRVFGNHLQAAGSSYCRWPASSPMGMPATTSVCPTCPSPMTPLSRRSVG